MLTADAVSGPVIPGGAAQTIQVHLTAFTSAASAASTSTAVRVTGQDGAVVSCDGTTFGHSCVANPWTFAFDGKIFEAARTVWTRVPTGTPDGIGMVNLHIDATNSDTSVPLHSLASAASTDGVYTGVLHQAWLPDIPVSAMMIGNYAVIQDPSYSLSPDGAVVVDRTTKRKINWLQPVGVNPSAPAIVAEISGQVRHFSGNTLQFSFGINFDVEFGVSETLSLQRHAALTPQCAGDTDCISGNVCPSALHVCVPQTAWNQPAAAVGNQFEDPLSARWWTAVSPTLSSAPAFATTGSDVIENLLCSTASASGQLSVGHLGLQLVAQPNGVSRSGDFACITDSTGTANGSTGAVGLITALDRTGQAQSITLYNQCKSDLAAAATSVPAINFAATTGPCVNLARALPAMRLLATGELSKQTQITTPNDDLHSIGLLNRLVQQWSELIGFVASTGLSEQEFEDAGAGTMLTPPILPSTPQGSATQLLSLLDTVDTAWGALLDHRIQPLTRLASNELNEDQNDFISGITDYRLDRAPFLYWTFNDSANGLDLMRGTLLDVSNSDPDAAPSTASQSFGGASFAAHLASNDSTAIQNTNNETVTFNLMAAKPIGSRTPYSGGLVFASGQLAIYLRNEQNSDASTLVVVHPTQEAPGYERIEFSSQDGGFFGDPLAGGAVSVAIVRDKLRKSYTVYTARSADSIAGTETKSFQHAVVGTLESLSSDELYVAGGPPVCVTPAWYDGADGCAPFAGQYDDVAIFLEKLSAREFMRFARARNDDPTRRDVWPGLPAGFATQEINTPIAAALLDAQSAELDVALRLIQQTSFQSQPACMNGDATARASIATAVARAGRVVRQSTYLIWQAINDPSQRTSDSFSLMTSKIGAVERATHALATCNDPYGIANSQVPLYFSGINPTADEVGAFFAVSDHMLSLASDRVTTAQAALANLRADWINARNSEIQQVTDDTTRATRVDDLKTRYGDQIRSLCGIPDETSAQVVDAVIAGTFNVDKCFVNPSPSYCRFENLNKTLSYIDPTCYRGTIGAALLDVRSAYDASALAYNTWNTAADNWKEAEFTCVQKDMDLHGCSAVNSDLANVQCPPGFKGIEDLARNYITAADSAENEKSIISEVEDGVAGVAGVVGGIATGNPVLVGGGIYSFIQLDEARRGASADELKRGLDNEVLLRGQEESLQSCWQQADQYARTTTTENIAYDEAVNRIQNAILAFQNNVSALKAAVLEAPIAIDHELKRPAVPIEFNYWLPQAFQAYKTAFDSARRYTYVALRATEYDTMKNYVSFQPNLPSRADVLGAWSPDALAHQISLMRDQTNSRKVADGKTPSLQHMVFDLGAKYFGLQESDFNFGTTLTGYLRPVYSSTGQYLGQGVRFSLVPDNIGETPNFRCAERIWRVNVGAGGLRTIGGSPHVKLIKSNTFASRLCDGSDGFQRATLRPADNLLVENGDQGVWKPQSGDTTADIQMVNFDSAALEDFKNLDTFLNGSSAELALEGMYGDYVLLFPTDELPTLTFQSMHDFFLRFDFLSVDNTPPISVVASPFLAAASPRQHLPTVQIDRNPAAITVAR